MEPARANVVTFIDRPGHHLNTAMLRQLYDFQRANNPALKDKSCADIACMAGMSESTLKNLLTGKNANPYGETLTGLLDAIGGGSLDRLYGYAPPRDFATESATYDATLMETMQHQVAELLKERDAVVGNNSSGIASNSAMIDELRKRIEKQDERLEFKAGRIQEQEVEIGVLNERLAAKDKTIKNLEGMHAERKTTVETLRRDLKLQRMAMAIIIFLMLIVEIIIAF